MFRNETHFASFLPALIIRQTTMRKEQSCHMIQHAPVMQRGTCSSQARIARDVWPTSLQAHLSLYLPLSFYHPVVLSSWAWWDSLSAAKDHAICLPRCSTEQNIFRRRPATLQYVCKLC